MESLETICYFSVFNYPITIEEILNYSKLKNEFEVKKELEILCQNKIISNHENYFYIGNDINCINKRLEGNLKAKEEILLAKKKAQFISKFPFVNGVGISGSLSKGYADSKSDWDFFVISKVNRVWLCRMYLYLYRKIVLKGNYKHFCVNYFISESKLEIDEKNRFTATEIFTILPVIGDEIFNKFFLKNSWVKDYFQFYNRTSNECLETKKKKIVKIYELLLQNKVGDFIELIVRKLSIMKMNMRYSNKNLFKLELKSTKEVSKAHLKNHQTIILEKMKYIYDNLVLKLNE